MTHEPDTTLWPTEDYTLWVRISPTGLKACLLPKAKGEALQIADLTWPKDRTEVLRRIEDTVYEEHLPIDIYQTRIEIEADRILLAPIDAVYDEDVAEDMYNLMYGTDGSRSDDVVCQPCRDICFIYGLPAGLNGFLERTFATAVITCSLAMRYSDLISAKESHSGQHMYIYLRPDIIDVLAFSGGKLQLANSYAYTEYSDAAYYTLNAWQTAGISQLQGHLHLHPEENTDPIPLRDLLAQYISHIDIS